MPDTNSDQKKDDDMAYVDPDDVLLNRGLNFSYGGGGGYGGRGGYGHSYGHSVSNAQGDGSVANANIMAARDFDLASNGVAAITTQAGFQNISDKINGSTLSIRDKLDTENLNRQFEGVRAEMSRQALDAAKCCCDNRVANAELKAEIGAVRDSQALAGTNAMFAVLSAKIDDIDSKGRH